MKLFNSIGPNPRVVNMFLAEKGVTLDKVDVDLRTGENRQAPYLAKNPSGQTPCLELDGGAYLNEITAICEYVDEKFPGGSLIGATPEERAETRMWTRRVDLKVCEPMANGFRYAEGLPMFQSRMRCLPEAAPGLKAVAQDGLQWFEDHMVGPYLCGERFSLADILLFAFQDFGNVVGQPLDAKYVKLNAWFAAVKARPSAAASA
ncbi:glutathione S-transferase family protein [Phenylobacterium sp.]|uniref:glutathione S-transferase family protein n=1 Tax=Phenylobacterium sp. TaxID=1871053 RepID=UPI0025D36894|nr:glutathione S-transferase family protein [Phenylobacterium sp.]